MKLIERRRGFTVPLAFVAGFLMPLSSEGQTGKNLSAGDLKNIDDETKRRCGLPGVSSTRMCYPTHTTILIELFNGL